MMPPTATLAAASEDHGRRSQSIPGPDDLASDRFPSGIKQIDALGDWCFLGGPSVALSEAA